MKECAAAHGVSPRAVTAWRRGGDARWVRFLANRAGENIGQLEAHSLRVDMEKSTPDEEEKAATRRFKLLDMEISRAIDRGELGSIPVITKAASEAFKLLVQTRESALQWRVLNRSLITGEALREITVRYLQPLQSLLKGLPSELATQLDPTCPARASQILEDWLLSRVQPALDEAGRALDQATSAPDPRQEDA